MEPATSIATAMSAEQTETVTGGGMVLGRELISGSYRNIEMEKIGQHWFNYRFPDFFRFCILGDVFVAPTDSVIGFLLFVISSSIFTYYTFWVVILISSPSIPFGMGRSRNLALLLFILNSVLLENKTKTPGPVSQSALRPLAQSRMRIDCIEIVTRFPLIVPVERVTGEGESCEIIRSKPLLPMAAAVVSSRTGIEVEQIKNWESPLNSSTPS
ncbi:hypothetical protein HHK36_019024 [Tetracentron sinense]|uniref:Uncharacterized protein n=1 Tax=Tetracentron sinense TaxID=13715 RepID=A0A834YTA6_TETSI|nr:hypothetical protein HHK36_019024 [Tetracentron sinense]